MTRRSDDRGAGGHHVGETRQLIARHAGFDLTRPADDKRRAVPAFPLVALHAPPGPGPVVLVRLAHSQNRGNFRPSVAGEYHQRVFSHPETFASLQ